MPVADPVAELNLPDSFRIVRGLLPAAGAALYGADAGLVWVDGHWAPDETVAAARLIAGAAGCLVHELPAGRALYIAPIPPARPDDEPMSLIVVCSRGAEAGAAEAIATLAAGMATYRRLNTELDGMAVELADRYEELNLVYATSDQAHSSPEGHTALDGLVASCRDHMDANLVALVLPVQGLTFERHDALSPVQRVSAFLQTVAGPFFEDFAAEARPVVLNNGFGAYARHLQTFGAMKLAATPVMDNRGVVCGALLMAKAADRADFNNSDKNLLSSIAEKVGRIVLSSYDALTGLLLRDEFERRLEAAHARTRESGCVHCLLSVDLDQLAVINATRGRPAGDEMLCCVARHLDQRQGGGRVAARLGSRHFGFLLEDCALESGTEFAEAIRLAISHSSFAYDNHPIEIAVSIGVASMDRTSRTAASVLHMAELASDAAREKGRNSVHVYRDGATSIIKHTEQMRWVGRIHEALRSDRFRLYAQRIRRLDGAGEAHLEVLLRLLDQDDRVQSPERFLPAAERYFLMPSIDRWVISHTLQALAASGKADSLTCSINLSGQSINDESFIQFVLDELDGAQVGGEHLCFEITETAAITSMETAQRFILQLKERGCRFSLDDFGTGLSSFSYLKELPVDFVKIDGSFVRGIIDDPVSESMVVAITEVGHAMGLEIIAEYVESECIETRLREIGVDYAQGYAIERPLPFSEHLRLPRATEAAAQP
ncbi:hypothetical protein BH24PSE2_BH24PSE2_14480 [soil metagenome]